MKKPALLLVAILLVFSIAPASAEDCIDLYGSHAYVEVDVKQATCTEDGYVLRRCSRAGCSSEEIVPFKKYGHSYDNGICIRCNAVEPAPVPTPTASPTTAPTATPTLAPTATPTLAPTATPTLAPTATPTLAPTATTTLAPTATPTLEPTATTTLAPTATPTLEPTATPTLAPTATPTLAPTATPTLVPKTTLNPTTAAPTPTPAIPSTETPVPFIPSLPPADTPVLPELLDPTPTPIATSAPTPAIQSTQTPLPFIPSLPPADTLIPLTPTPEPAATHSPTEVPIHPLSEDTPIPDPTETLSPTGIPSPTPKHFAPKTPNVTTQKDENIWDLEISFSLSDENERLLFLAKKIGPANQAADPADPYQYEATLSYLSGTAEPVLILQGRCWFSATVHGQREDNNPFRLTITRFPQLAITFEAPSVSASFLPDPDQDILLLLHILGFEDTGSPFLSIELSGTNYAP